MQLLREYPEKLYLGKNQDGEEIYMSRPSWNFDWYWGFGYIGNKHLDSLGEGNLFNNIKIYFQYFTLTDKELWIFCEIVKTIYTLRDTAELVNRGGSRYTNNPCKELLTKPDWYNEINNVLIPKLIDEMYQVLKV